MNRLALIASTGVLALMLTACDNNSAPKTTPVKTDNVLDQTQHNVDHSKKVHEDNMKKEMNANENKATDTTGTTPVQPATDTQTH